MKKVSIYSIFISKKKKKKRFKLGEDSIESVRNHCSNVYKEWLQQVGATFQGGKFHSFSFLCASIIKGS
jgi:hypothetical protein